MPRLGLHNHGGTMITLSQEDRNRIQAEELFRAEVQRALATDQAGPTRGQRVIRFLNTGLGVWLLSTVVVGGASFGYATLTSRLQTVSMREAAAERLSAELYLRLYQWGKILSRAETKRAVDATPETFRFVYDAFISAPAHADRLLPRIPGSDGTPIVSACPEYNGLGLPMIIYLLAQTTDDKQAAEYCSEVFEFLITWNPQSEPPQTLEQYVGLINSHLGKHFDWRIRLSPNQNTSTLSSRQPGP